MNRLVEKARGLAQLNLNTTLVKDLTFPLPPLPEQHRIVRKIEELFKICDEIEERGISIEEKVKELKSQILQSAIQGKLVPQDPNDEPASVLLEKIKAEKEKLIKEGKIKRQKSLPEIKPEEIPFEVPEGWEWVRLGTISINRDGERIPLSTTEREVIKGQYDYYGASGVIDKINKFIFTKPLLLISEDGANLALRSKNIAFIARGNYWVNNHAHVLDFLHDQSMRYLSIYINATDVKPYLTGTAQPKFNQDKLNRLHVALPPLSEQNRIVQKIEELFKVCDEILERVGGK